MSTVAWLDHDEERQRVTQTLLDMLSETAAIDELGLGVVHDIKVRWVRAAERPHNMPQLVERLRWPTS